MDNRVQSALAELKAVNEQVANLEEQLLRRLETTKSRRPLPKLLSRSTKPVQQSAATVPQGMLAGAVRFAKPGLFSRVFCRSANN